jgi:hypothetical protein
MARKGPLFSAVDLRGLRPHRRITTPHDLSSNTNLFGLCESAVQFVKSADEEVAHQAIERARVATQQNTKAVAEMLPLLIGDERQVRGRVDRLRAGRFHFHGCAPN